MMPNDLATLRAKPVIVWLDYGLDGWSPRGFDTIPEAIEFISAGETYGNPFIVTRRLDLNAAEAP